MCIYIPHTYIFKYIRLLLCRLRIYVCKYLLTAQYARSFSWNLRIHCVNRNKIAISTAVLDLVLQFERFYQHLGQINEYS